MAKSKIEWTDEVWNPVTGCTKVSQGCKNCYAETIAERFWATQYEPNEDGTPRGFTDVRLHAERLDKPLRWKKPRRVFVNSMSDLFHEKVRYEFIDQVFEVMHQAYRHTFMILTKRPWNMWGYVSQRYSPKGRSVLPNVWLGVSCEDQASADLRVPALLQTPAAVRFVSCEPLLGPVDLKAVCRDGNTGYQWNALAGLKRVDQFEYEVVGALDWVIVGGESGTGARPMDVEWAWSLREQCRKSGVAFFMKQMGSVWADQFGPRGKGGDPEFWEERLRVRRFPAHTDFDTDYTESSGEEG